MVEIYDCTLRDGTQGEGISVTVEDKLAISRKLDQLNVAYIEGGYPGSNPKDIEFFKRAQTELKLKNAKLAAFGSTCKKETHPSQDKNIQSLLEVNTPVITLFGKAWDIHVTKALQTTLEENLRMVRESVRYLKDAGKTVFFDAEHFFDGYTNNPEYAKQVLKAAADGGVDSLVLCETNGGKLPFEVYEITRAMKELFPQVAIGIHCHNDTGCAVANSLEGVRAGATQVQGTANGVGERVGNADLITIIPNLEIKMGLDVIGPEALQELTSISHAISQILNVPVGMHHPYTGTSAFAHKGGMHASAIARLPEAYNHIKPETVGNFARMVVSELAGKASLISKAEELGFDLQGNDQVAVNVLNQVKERENQGFSYEIADGSLALIIDTEMDKAPQYFELESFRVISDKREDGKLMTEATLKIHVGDERFVATAEGNGPVNALDTALRMAITKFYPTIRDFELTDYKVRVLDENVGTDAVTRVIITTTDNESGKSWGTIGVDENVIEASWQALVDSIDYGLSHITKKRV